MKILWISGSSRDKKTNYMLSTFLESTWKDFEIIKLKDCNINPCLNCKWCHKSYKCIQNDDMQKTYQKMEEADLIVLASPTYFDNVSWVMKTFMDRCLPFYFSRKLESKKAVYLTLWGFRSLVDLGEDWVCIWCKDWNQCERTVMRCIDSMKFFSRHLGMENIGEVFAIHGDPESKREELMALGKNL